MRNFIAYRCSGLLRRSDQGLDGRNAGMRTGMMHSMQKGDDFLDGTERILSGHGWRAYARLGRPSVPHLHHLFVMPLHHTRQVVMVRQGVTHHGRLLGRPSADRMMSATAERIATATVAVMIPSLRIA